MEITIQKTVIMPVLNKIQSITNRKSNLSITENILLTAKDNITISVTNLEAGFVGTYPAQVEHPGAICLNSKKFYEIIRQYPNELINIKKDERFISIGSEQTVFYLLGQNIEDYPQLPTQSKPMATIDGVSFKSALQKVLFVFPDSIEKRPFVLGVNLELTENKLRMVSTDIKQIAVVDVECQYSGEPVKALIPKKALSEAINAITNNALSLSIQNNEFIITNENETIAIALLEGDFPHYEPILNTEGSKVVFNKKVLLNALRRARVLISEQYPGAVLQFNKDNMAISVNNPEQGEYNEEININSEVNNISAMFNPAYIIAALNVMHGEDIIAYIKDNTRPFLFVNDKLFYAVMPMKS